MFVALMCHAPIVVPAVGGARSAHCRSTTRAMHEVAVRAAAHLPDRVVLLSPHSPRQRRSFAAWPGRHVGDLGDFQAPDVRVDLPDAPEVANTLGLGPVEARRLDHGAMVPLSFLWDAGWRGRTAILSLPWDEIDSESVGRGLADLPGHTVVIASGDMSHRLQPGAPAGFHPNAHRFDDAFVEALRRDDWAAALGAEARALAAEDVVQSARVAMVAAEAPLWSEVLCYEAPFGVGYTEAILRDPRPPLYAIARFVATRYLHGHPLPERLGGPPAQGVFVTLRRRGELRGCIGHVEARRSHLWDEVADVTLAAIRDPRFPPLSAPELPEIDWEVSLLDPPERVVGTRDLDPHRYGVIVSLGSRRGLLLPGIEGIDDPHQQVALARRKAGIAPRGAVNLERFTVTKVVQP